MAGFGPKFAVFAVFGWVWLCWAGVASAETCKKCEYVDCLEQMIAQKLGAAAIYEQQAQRVREYYRSEGKPLREWDLKRHQTEFDRNKTSRQLELQTEEMQGQAERAMKSLPTALPQGSASDSEVPDLRRGSRPAPAAPYFVAGGRALLRECRRPAQMWAKPRIAELHV